MKIYKTLFVLGLLTTQVHAMDDVTMTSEILKNSTYFTKTKPRVVASGLQNVGIAVLGGTIAVAGGVFGVCLLMDAYADSTDRLQTSGMGAACTLGGLVGLGMLGTSGYKVYINYKQYKALSLAK